MYKPNLSLFSNCTFKSRIRFKMIQSLQLVRKLHKVLGTNNSATCFPLANSDSKSSCYAKTKFFQVKIRETTNAYQFSVLISLGVCLLQAAGFKIAISTDTLDYKLTEFVSSNFVLQFKTSQLSLVLELKINFHPEWEL